MDERNKRVKRKKPKVAHTYPYEFSVRVVVEIPKGYEASVELDMVNHVIKYNPQRGIMNSCWVPHRAKKETTT